MVLALYGAMQVISSAQAKDFNVCDFGAIPDNQTVSTAAIQKTIDACAEQGGGTVVFSKGTYLTGAVFLKERVDLRVDEGVTLKAVPDDAAYPNVFGRVAGIETHWPAALINARDLTGVRIYGKGTIDGSGKMWWDRFWKMEKEYSEKDLRWVVDYDCKRPRLLLIHNCTNVSLEGLTLKEPAFWTVHICYCTNVRIDGLFIRGNRGEEGGPSTDGIDIDSSANVLIQNCDIDCHDDNICLKSGRDADGLRVNRPTYNVIIRDCIARAGYGMLSFGSDSSGGIYHVEAYRLKAENTRAGVRFKSTQGRGGMVRDIDIHDIEMKNAGRTLELNYDWFPQSNAIPDEVRKQITDKGRDLPHHWGVLLQPVSQEQGTPRIRDIFIRNVESVDSKTAFFVRGLDRAKAERFHLQNIRITAAKAGSIRNAANWTFENLTLQTRDGSKITLEQCDHMQGLE